MEKSNDQSIKDNQTIESSNKSNSIDSNDDNLNNDQSNKDETNKDKLNEEQLNNNQINDAINIDENNDLNNQLNNDTNSQTTEIDLSSTDLFLNLKDKNRWILEYNQDINDELINILNEYTASLLINNTILSNENELIKNKDNLIQKLTKLPLRLFNRSNNNESIMNLSNKFRLDIINQLMKNEYFVLNYKDSIGEDDKDNLIEENKDLISKLKNLPLEKEIEFDDYSNNKKRKHDAETESEEDASKYVSKTNFDNLKNRIKLIEKEFGYFKKSVEFEIGKRFNCVLNDLKNFFEKDNEFSSSNFYYLNLKWKIKVKSIKINSRSRKRFLAFFLYLDDKSNDNFNWQLKTNYDLILKNNLPNRPDKIHKIVYTFKRSKGFGIERFIQEDDLFDLNNGYVKNNSIGLEVYLKADKMIKDNY